MTVFVIVSGTAVVFKSKMHLVRGENVRIQGNGVRLEATIALPRWKKGPYPAAVVVHGSGRETRRDLAGYGGRFAPEGLAILMYDKRGVGKSTGEYWPFRVSDSNVRLRELAEDVLAGVEYLKQRPDIDPKRIGLVGGSQAGWVMPLVASQSDDIAFIVSMSGPAVSCGHVDYYQTLTGVGRGTPSVAAASEIEKELDRFSGPRGFDPTPVLQSLTVPMLWILGGQDRNVPTSKTVAVLESILENGNGVHEIEFYPQANHDLHDATTGRLIDPWPDIRSWLERLDILRG